MWMYIKLCWKELWLYYNNTFLYCLRWGKLTLVTYIVIAITYYCCCWKIFLLQIMLFNFYQLISNILENGLEETVYIFAVEKLSLRDIEWLLFNINPAIFQICHCENKLIFNEMMMRFALYQTNTLSWIFIVLAHWNKSAGRQVAPLRQIILIPSQPVFALSP